MPGQNLDQVAASLIAQGKVTRRQTTSGRTIEIPRFRTTAERMDYIFTHADVRDAVMEEVNEFLEFMKSRPPLPEIDDQWKTLVHDFEPDIPMDRLWNVTTVGKYYEYMLPSLVTNSKDSEGRTQMKSSALKDFKEAFIRSIIKHGAYRWSWFSMDIKLDDQVHTLTTEYQLE